MSGRNIRPTTLAGIKRLAKEIKKQQGVSLAQAQDESARIADFQNFRHAQNSLNPAQRPVRAAVAPSPTYPLAIEAAWRDIDTWDIGSETLTVELSEPRDALVTKAQMQASRKLRAFRPHGEQVVYRQDWVRSQDAARREACKIARIFQFMDATGLRPSAGHSRAFPGGSALNAVPGRDHYSIWFDPGTRRYLFADEPYEAAVSGEKDAARRAAWAREHGWRIVKPSWPGMYYPEGSARLYLISSEADGLPLDEIAARLDRLPRIEEAPWTGASAPIRPGNRSRRAPEGNRPRAT